MDQFENAKRLAWKKFHDSFECEHENTRIARRIIRGGATQYVMQCLRCGRAAANPVKKDAAISMAGGVEPIAFDEKLIESFDELKAKASEEINKQFDRSVFFNHYDEYLESEQWAKKRSLVFKRAKCVCEGCGEAVATEVHHLSYKHVGDEFLFELVALCHACHERWHEEDGAE
jgi:hypothetical protein